MNDDLRLLVYTFDSAGQAEAARSALEVLDRHLGGVQGHVAVVRREADGSISLREPQDLREELSDLASRLVGGATWFVYTFVGLMGPQPAVIAEQLTDDAVHRLVRDGGFPDAALHDIGQELAAGSAAVVALLPDAERGAAVAELEQLGGRLWDHPLPPAVTQALRSWEGPVK